MKSDTITCVTYRWDAQIGVEPGWYCQCFAGDDLKGDSQKLWFGCDVGDYASDEEDELVQALHQSFPDAEIVRI